MQQRQQRILAAIYHQANRPAQEIAGLLGYQAYTVRREIGRLISAGIVRRQAFIDVYRLGYVQYEFYVSLGAGKQAAVSRFTDFLVRHPKVAWIGQYSGAFQYLLTVCLRQPEELREFVTSMGEHSGVALLDRQFSISLSYEEFPLKYLSTEDNGSQSLSFGRCGQEQIDQIDHQILTMLSKEGECTQSEMARRLKMPLSTCNARVLRLQESGIIAGYTYVVDFSKLGVQAFVLLLKTRTHTGALTEKLHRFCQGAREAAYFCESLGAYDYKVGVHLTAPVQIVSFSQKLSDLLADDLIDCHTLTAFDYLKVDRYPFKDFIPDSRPSLR